MSKSHKRSTKRGGRRHHRKTAKRGGSMLSAAALPLALLGLNTMFGKKSSSKARKSRKSRKSRM